MKQERLGRIDAAIQRALANAISTQLTDPRLGFTTVTRVETAADLKTAKVYVSVIGDRHAARLTLDALTHAAGFLRGELGHAVDLRHTPELLFIEDRSTEKAIEMSKTLAQLAAAPEVPTAEQVVAFLQHWDSFVFVSHVKPDGDTLGAGLALGLALRAQGKTVAYFQQDPVPRNLRFLADTDKVSRDIPQALVDHALWVFCDMSDAGRAGEYLPEIPRERILVIDHHLGNTCFGAVNYILTEECSTGTCVLHLLKAMQAKITPEIATCLLTTIMTDTGGFMHSNTTASVLALSAELIEAGAQKEEITNQIFANKRFAATRLVGDALRTARLEDDGAYCWSVVDEAMFALYGADSEDTEEIIGHLRAVEGVEVAALFKVFPDGVRVSLRSSGRINVQAAAARLDGGGHFRAAGLTFVGPIEEAITAVREALRAEGLS